MIFNNFIGKQIALEALQAASIVTSQEVSIVQFTRRKLFQRQYVQNGNRFVVVELSCVFRQ